MHHSEYLVIHTFSVLVHAHSLKEYTLRNDIRSKLCPHVKVFFQPA